tara:strand:- start:344 stop:577 length:234 start_codon:yes stop_codon:yes gene_type:complete
MSITDNFYQEMFQDLVFQEYLYQMEKKKTNEYNELLRIESEAYDIMCEQSNRDIELYENCLMEREYRKISEWDLVNI